MSLSTGSGASMTDAPEPRYSRSAIWRWGMLGLVILGAIINYLARNSLAVLVPQLQALLHFGVREYSYVIGAFQLAYTVMQPVCGWVLDRIGLRIGFALFAVLWSLAAILHAGAGGWGGLAAARGLLGAAEATAVPAGVKMSGEWFKGPARSMAVGWLNVGISIGAMLAPAFTVGLALAYGWRAPFVAVGVLGFLWAGLWLAVYRSPPSAKPSAEARPPFAAIFRTRAFWALAVPRFLAEPAWQTFSFWLPLYLAHERGWALSKIALFAWLPFLAADLGGLAGGYLSPFLIKVFRLDLLKARIVGMGIAAVLMIAPGCVALAADPLAAIALLCIGGFAHQIITVSISTLSADLFDPRTLGTANGWIGSAGWTGGLIFSLLVGALVERTGYGVMFAALSAFDLIGFACLLILMRGVRLPDRRDG